MKILLINTVDTARNGITNVIFNHVKAIKDEDVTFDLVTKNKPDAAYDEVIKKRGGHVFVIPRSMKKIVKYFFALKRLIKCNQYDAVHIHGNSHTLVIELLAAKLGGCKVRMTHAHNTVCGSLLMHNGLAGLFNALCTHRLACGNDAGLFMYGKQPFVVIRNGIDVNHFQYNASAGHVIRNQYNFGDDIVIGHIGLFNNAKNQAFLIDVLKELLKTNPHYRLMLIGEGPLLRDVEEKTAALHLVDQVTFVGTTDIINEYLSAVDMVMMPSFYEGLPLTLIEAQANGVQCIVSDRITKEVDLTGNIRFLPIDRGADMWAKTATDMKLIKDRETASREAIECIVENGYSIEKEAAKLHTYYCNAVKKAQA